MTYRIVVMGLAISFGLMMAIESFASEIQSQSSNYLMAVLGDSIPSGTFADTTVKPSNDSTYQDFDYRFYDYFVETYTNHHAMNRKSKSKRSFLSVIGRYDWPRLITNRHTLSWASGDRVQSHYVRLRQWLQKNSGGKDNLKVKSFSVPGERVEHLQEQVKKMIQELKRGKYAGIKYIVLMVGANDVCNSAYEWGTPAELMRQELRVVIQKILEIKQAEPIRILVASIPRIPDLSFPGILESKGFGDTQCKKLRSKLLKYCQKMIQWDSPEEYAERMAIIEDKNQALAEVVNEYQLSHPELEMVFSHSVTENHVKSEQLAADCFHPNQAGQETIADLLWKDQPWFK